MQYSSYKKQSLPSAIFIPLRGSRLRGACDNELKGISYAMKNCSLCSFTLENIQFAATYNGVINTTMQCGKSDVQLIQLTPPPKKKLYDLKG